MSEIISTYYDNKAHKNKVVLEAADGSLSIEDLAPKGFVFVDPDYDR